jgi:DNA-binding NarL/FixJ family response regulator
MRLVLVEDHQVIRAALIALLAQDDDLVVVGEAGDAHTAYQVVDERDPEVVLVDVHLPGPNGVALTRELVRRAPHRKVLLFSMHVDERFAAQGLAAGARGYAAKSDSPAELRTALRQVAAGERYLSPRLRPDVVRLLWTKKGASPDNPIGDLSSRELEVFDLLVRGYDNNGLAAHLCISAKTVETHRARIMRKLGVHSLADLVRFANKHGVAIDVDP